MLASHFSFHQINNLKQHSLCLRVQKLWIQNIGYLLLISKLLFSKESFQIYSYRNCLVTQVQKDLQLYIYAYIWLSSPFFSFSFRLFKTKKISQKYIYHYEFLMTDQNQLTHSRSFNRLDHNLLQKSELAFQPFKLNAKINNKDPDVYPSLSKVLQNNQIPILRKIVSAITLEDQFLRFIISNIFCHNISTMENEEQTLSTPGVIEKYQVSAKIANEVLTKLIKKITVGSKIFQLCLWTDGQIYQELSKVYNKKQVFKGLAFPTTISVNELCGYYSPLPEDSTNIKEGDLVKVQLGVHVDGFAAFVAHTIVVQSDKNAQVTGKKADVILAAYKAAQAALRLIKPGHINNQVTEVIQKVCNSYEVNPLEGVLSHELKKHLIDGNKVIINKQTFQQRVDPQQFAVNDVFALDVFVSSGEGKTKESDLRCTVYKRALDRSYNLKIKQSRQFFNDVLDRYPSFCFSLTSFEDAINARIGIKECLEHELLVPYPVLTQKAGTFVAQFKFTVIITKGKTTAITGLPIDENQFKSEFSIKDEKILELLATSMQKDAQKKKKVQAGKE